MPGLIKRRLPQRMMPARKRPRRSFAMHPGRRVIDDLLAGDVVRNEINQFAFHARNDLLERFQHQRIDQQMIDRRKIGPQRHVVDIRIRLARAQRRIHQLAIIARQRNRPLRKLFLQIAKLSLGQQIAKPARPAMRQKSHVPIHQPKNLRCPTCFIALAYADDLRLAKMIAAAV